MAGPQFSSSAPIVVPSGVKRRFTLKQANQSLALVSRIVRDIVASHSKATMLQDQIEHGRAPKDAEQDMQRALSRLDDYLEELNEVGCELKDCETGLIDFIGRHQGRDVCLCWKLGEENIGYWHELSTGFAGRKPVSQLQED